MAMEWLVNEDLLMHCAISDVSSYACVPAFPGTVFHIMCSVCFVYSPSLVMGVVVYRYGGLAFGCI